MLGVVVTDGVTVAVGVTVLDGVIVGVTETDIVGEGLILIVGVIVGVTVVDKLILGVIVGVTVALGGNVALGVGKGTTTSLAHPYDSLYTTTDEYRLLSGNSTVIPACNCTLLTPVIYKISPPLPDR